MFNFETVEVKFKNLPIGYYFISEDKAYVKINDYGAIILFSYLEPPLFTNAPTRFSSVDKNLKYVKPSFVASQFEPDLMVGFIEKNKLKKYVHEYYQKNRKSIPFSELENGSYFFDPANKTFYKKISYYNAVPIYKNKYGLDGNENINLSIIASANRTEKLYNKLIYNGTDLIDFDSNAWNIVWFEDDFRSFSYNSFDTEREWTKASYNMLEYVRDIPDGKLVFVSNGNNSNRITNIKESKEVKKIKEIYNEYPNANEILSAIGITDNIINNISHGSTILLICKKGREVIHYDKAYSYHKDMKFDMRDYTKPYVLEYTYSYNSLTKTMNMGAIKPYELNYKVYSSTLKEVTCRLLHDLPDSDPRVTDDPRFNVFDF